MMFLYNMVIDLPVRGARPIKIGNSFYFRVPYQYISHGAIKKNRLYSLQVGKKVVLEPRMVGKKAAIWCFLIDAKVVRDKLVKVDKYYNLVLNMALCSKSD